MVDQVVGAGTAHGVAEGETLWSPSAEWIERTNLTHFLEWLRDRRGHDFGDYFELWRWSTTDLEGFWGALWDYFDIQASAPPQRVLGRREMPGAEWFPGARLNYAQHVLRQVRPGSDALYHVGEDVPSTGMAWEELAAQVRTLASRLRELGVQPGQRVAAYVPNIPEAMVALFATTAIGAVWASCSPDFGWRGAADRFAQLEPTVLFAVDGYRYGGREFDRRDEVRQLVEALPTLTQVVHVSHRFGDGTPPTTENVASHRWEDVLDGPAVPAEEFAFEQVPFDHPLWVLFSSGTTGLPKAIVHGHGGILLEQLKLQTFHMDLRRGDRLFFFTTTSWMMWNFIASSLLLGVAPILYDGNPAHPGPEVLWRVAQDARATLFGASPSYVRLMDQAGVVPREQFDLSALRTIMPAGSPVSPEITAWFYRNVKDDLWVATGSGGTDCCTGFVGGVPTLPVRAGEIQAPSLGVAVAAFAHDGRPVVDEVGELVITEPMPSMPLGFWGDRDHQRYRETYFADFPGVWRHGDFFRINERGGCYVLGRSDATLNRHGVRIGTAEIYRTLAQLDEVEDALIVNLERADGGFFMPLFVKPAPDVEFDASVVDRIRDRLRRDYTPRHVPDDVVAVPDIPVTLTGKKLEVPVRKLLLGTPVEQAVNLEAVANPAALEPFLEYARQHAM
ncbi:acetoacetate--CoA ligase [Egicoccus sp. AB-alg2]|uniref:acetoacetate--CoA ligase n=1 Tax=Egicoccus sp. AB-alg2 TaxID=3242693 RepID=UPI00359E8EB9